MEEWHNCLERDGCAILEGALSETEVQSAIEACNAFLTDGSAQSSVLASESGAAYGARNLLQFWPDVMRFIRVPALADPLRCILGPAAVVVRGLYFDKPPGHSWALPWHRDLTIAVKKHGPLGRFARPTTKAGVPHVEAPRELLAGMLTVRIHLDEVTSENGPLQVIPGSHKLAEADSRKAEALTCGAGSAVLMRPLLLHASSHCKEGCQGHRRTLHLECATEPELPDGFKWHDCLPLQPV